MTEKRFHRIQQTATDISNSLARGKVIIPSGTSWDKLNRTEKDDNCAAWKPIRWELGDEGQPTRQPVGGWTPPSPLSQPMTHPGGKGVPGSQERCLVLSIESRQPCPIPGQGSGRVRLELTPMRARIPLSPPLSPAPSTRLFGQRMTVGPG